MLEILNLGICVFILFSKTLDLCINLDSTFLSFESINSNTLPLLRTKHIVLIPIKSSLRSFESIITNNRINLIRPRLILSLSESSKITSSFLSSIGLSFIKELLALKLIDLSHELFDRLILCLEILRL